MDDIRHDWTREELGAVYSRPFVELLYEAQTVHRRYFPAGEVQISTLLSIKTGGCPEDCGYCSQSAHHDAGVQATKLMDVSAVAADAKRAKQAGATRFCMGAAWRSPKDKDLDAVCEMVSEVKSIGMETCVTLGMLTDAQAAKLKEAGLDYYNHNIDTSPEYYGEIITTRTFQDRLDTLESVREAGIHVCSGGIIGMGESAADRVGMIHSLCTLPEHPESVPINLLMRVEGTKLADTPPLDVFEFVRTIALARIAMPKSFVRLSAGREYMSEEAQALCFLAGANSVFYGEKLLTTPNPDAEKDRALFAKLGLKAMGVSPP
jgi:biotin synthase